MAVSASSHKRFRFTLSFKLALMLVLTAFFSSAAVLGINVYVAEQDAEKRVAEAIDRNMRVAWSELRHIGTTFSLQEGKLLANNAVLNDLNELPDRIADEVGGNATIFMGDTRVATNVRKPDGSRAVGTQLAKNAAHEAVFAGKSYRGQADILGVSYITGYDPIFDASGKVIGILFVGIPIAQFYAAIIESVKWSALGSAGVGLAVIFIMVLIGRATISRPVAAMTEAMDVLASGDLTVDIPIRKSADEIGDMSHALQVFKESAVQMEEMRRHQKEMEAQAAEERKRAMMEMADKFESEVMGIVQVVSSAATEMHSLLEDMSRRSQAVNESMTSVASATDETSSNVSTVASATEELSSSIGEIGRQVTSAARISAAAAEEAERTNAMVQELATSAEKIGEVVNLINDIATQTNLLALNATIEAARAGEAGKGFAVVAGEVKGLATQTGKATEEITNQIGAVQQQTRSAVEAIRKIGDVIQQVREISSSIASAIEEQGAATAEISHNVQQAARGTEEVSANVGKVAHAATENMETERQMVSASDELAHNAEKLRQQVTEFLRTVRAG